MSEYILLGAIAALSLIWLGLEVRYRIGVSRGQFKPDSENYWETPDYEIMKLYRR